METFCITTNDGQSSQKFEMDLPSVQAAQQEITRIFGEMIVNGIAEFWAARDWQISVARAGMPLFVLISFSVHPLRLRRPRINAPRVGDSEVMDGIHKVLTWFPIG